MSGPLEGIKVLEVGGIGPVPFAGMVLGGLGANVLRVERPGAGSPDALLAGRPAIEVDLKERAGRELALRLADEADVLMEGFRPGVVERLGIGPDVCRARNPRLVYARVTGWGQDGPYAHLAAHDINYLAAAGLLSTVGRSDAPPVPPVNYVGDYGAGGMLAAVGITSALIERERSGEGQVIDAAIVDGAAMMMADVLGRVQDGRWTEVRGSNEFDSGGWFYDTYETADGGHIALGAFEPKFREEFLRRVGLPVDLAHDGDEHTRERVAAAIRTRTRASWSEHFAGSDACVTPVWTPSEAPCDPHLRSRQTYRETAGHWHPAPAPRFSRTPGDVADPGELIRLRAEWTALDPVNGTAAP